VHLAGRREASPAGDGARVWRLRAGKFRVAGGWVGNSKCFEVDGSLRGEVGTEEERKSGWQCDKE
jgi:hypothetical protein